MARYRCKPVEVEALRLSEVWECLRDGSGPSWVQDAHRNAKLHFEGQKQARIQTLEGWVTTPMASWLVRGALGEIWPVQDAQFEHKYEEIAND